MTQELIPVKFHKILQSESYTTFILHALDKKFAIFTQPHIGHIIHANITEQEYQRPTSFHLLNHIFEKLEIQAEKIVIENIEDCIYHMRFFISQNPKEESIALDARPSDCLIFAIEKSVPLYCSPTAFDQIYEIEDFEE